MNATPPALDLLTDNDHVLVVDDEALARTLMESQLKKRGARVTVCNGYHSAIEAINREGALAFNCIVSDYKMPDCDGLDLLNWIKGRDPHLAVIIVTAQGEQDVIMRTLRGGAVDYLNKPVKTDDLLQAVRRGVKSTVEQRALGNTIQAVQEVGVVQDWMLGIHSSNRRNHLQLHFHPLHEAGGDFAAHYDLPGDRELLLVADVSGHDLKAAFVGAYFQGWLRGMIVSGRDISEVFRYFNSWLLGAPELRQGGAQTAVSASISACAVIINHAEETLTVHNCGAPLPHLVMPYGDACQLGRSAGFPLGWFSDHQNRPTTVPLESARLFLWTDGLDDFARQRGINPASFAARLERDKKHQHVNQDLADAPDDILLLSSQLRPAESASAPSFELLFYETYPGNEATEIDGHQACWEKSLKHICPDLDEPTLFDLLLSTREAVLNGMNHGCAGKKDNECTLKIFLLEQSSLIRVTVSDPGNGHQFPIEEHQRLAVTDLLNSHRGLCLIHKLSTSVTTRNEGSEISMDFIFPPKPHPTHELQTG